jgi:DNA-binding transcriptional ArsR family regulator
VTGARGQPVFAAVAEPVRRRLLEHLAARGPATATELARHYPQTRQALLKHLNVLAAAGLVRARRQGRDKRYDLRPEPLRELERWQAALAARWEARLARLKALAEDEP